MLSRQRSIIKTKTFTASAVGSTDNLKNRYQNPNSEKLRGFSDKLYLIFSTTFTETKCDTFDSNYNFFYSVWNTYNSSHFQ